jgi:hypothetical protein
MKRFLLICAAAIGLSVLAAFGWFLSRQPAPAVLAQGQQACPLNKDEAARAAEAFAKMNLVLQHPRCLNCHGAYGDLHTNPNTKHPGGYIPIDSFGVPLDPAHECILCHDLAAKNKENKWQLAPEHMFFTGKTAVQVCQRFRSTGDGTGTGFLNHLAGDELILLGFEGKKAHSDKPAEPPAISHDDFLVLAENWVAEVFRTRTQTDWTKPFPGDASCGCDPNDFKQEIANVDAQMQAAAAALKNSLTECTSKKFLECVSVENEGWTVRGFLARELAGFGSERTDIKVRGNATSADAQRAFQISTESYQTPVPRGEMFAFEAFEAVPGAKNSGVLQVWLDPYFDSNKEAGKAFGHALCGNLRVEYSMFLTGDSSSGQPLVNQTRAQIKTLMQQLGSAFVGAGVCSPEQISSPSSSPAPAPLLGTINKIDGTMEVKILRAGKDFRGEWEEDNLNGKPLNYGDVICFKGLGELQLTWWDGSIVTLSEGSGSVIMEHCLEVGVKRPDARSSQSITLKTLSTLGRAIRAQVTGKDEIPSIAELEDYNVSVTVKGTEYILGNDPATGASIICALEGTVHLTPRNASLAPFDLQAGNQVQISANSIGAIAPGCTLPDASNLAQPQRNVARMTLQAARRFVFAGETVRVPVWLIKSQNVANLNFGITYDSSVIQPVGDVGKGNLLDNALFTANPNSSGQILVGVAGTQGIQNDVGTLVEIPLRVVGKPGDVSPLLLNVTTINDPNGSVLEIDRLAGEIVIVNDDGTVPPFGGGGAGGTGGGAGGGASGGGATGGTSPGGIQNGDCDGSGALNELDALCALEMSTGLRTVRLFVDMDASGDVTSRDAVILLQRAVGQ